MGIATLDSKAPITVERALALSEVQSGDPVVCAGRAHLSRAIRWVHSAEVPDIARLLRGGELLLTTGIGVGKREHEQRRFVRGLAERDVAGLMIELGQAFEDVPDSFVGEADDRGLPLIVLNREVPFVEITEAIHREILQRQHRFLEQGTKAYDRFSQIVLGGGDMTEVMRALAITLRNPILLENERRELLSHAEFRTPETEVLAVWRTMGGEPGQVGLDEAYALPVPMGGGDRHGRLVALPLDGPLTELDRVVLERVVWLIGLILLRSDQEKELSLRTRGDFLVDLTEGKLDERNAAAEARSLGFDAQSFLVPAVVRLGHRGANSTAERIVEVGSDVRNELVDRRLRAIVGVRAASRELLLVVATRSADDRLRIADRIAATAREVAARRLRGGEPVVAIGGAPGWAEMPTAMRETCEAAAAAEQLEPRPWHDATEANLGRLLWQLRESAALESFVQRQLGPLLQHDEGRKNKLMPTLEALCRQGGNKAETARELFLARQALYNRLRRINEILGFDVTDPEHFPAANLAVMAARHMR